MGGARGGAAACGRVRLGPVTRPLASGGGILRNLLAASGGRPNKNARQRRACHAGAPGGRLHSLKPYFLASSFLAGAFSIAFLAAEDVYKRQLYSSAEEVNSQPVTGA